MAGVARAWSTGSGRELFNTMTCAPVGDGTSMAWPSFILAKLSSRFSGSCSAARTASFPPKL